MCTLKVTLWKHYKIRVSGVSSLLLTIFEVLIPTTIFLLVIYAKSNVGDFDKIYVNESTYLNSISKEELVTRINVGSTNVLFAPDTQFTSDLVREVQLKLNLYNQDIKPFINKEELLDYYNNYEYDGTTIVILFKNIQYSTPHHLNYDVKIYEEGIIWNTDKLFLDNFNYIPGIGSENYLDKGYAAIQIALDTSFMEMITNSTFNTSLSFQEFPYPPYLNTDGVTVVFRHILPFLTIISFIFICPITLKRIVLEKSSGLKELLKIGGIKSWMIWTGWFINGIVINVISAICIAFILTQKLRGVNYPLIEHCNTFILALFLIFYCSATITFFFVFSTIFNRGTLAMVLGVLLWIISYIVFIGAAANIDVMSKTVKVLLLLFPTVALYYGYNTISLFEMRETNITFCNLFESPTSSYDDISLGIVLIMLLVDTVIYFVLVLYLDKLWPGPYGISKPWHFPIQKLLSRLQKNAVAEASNELLLESSHDLSLRPILRMRNVVKRYENHVAVDNLNLDIYEGTITSLLGENGAGKSTTMLMLTGLTKVTSGVIAINSYNINENVEEARKDISICMQEDLLYDELTVMQHLLLFGMLKGLSMKDAEKRAIELLESTLKLENKANEYVCNLSGGMKRRLSLGIALMGDPKILILDEPTSGIDIEGRHEIWDLISSFKGKKTVLISTHFLEEAEYLSDYVAIMDNARLVCCETPMDLKKKYNVGYNFSINCDNGQRQKLLNFLNNVKDVIKQDNDKVIECCFNNDKKKEFYEFLGKLENEEVKYKLSSTTLEDIYLKACNKNASSSDAIKSDENMIDDVQCNCAKLLNFADQYRIKRWTFLKKKMLQYISLSILFIIIALATLLLGESGYADMSKDGRKIPLTLNLYGNTDVYYSTLGVERETALDTYFKNIINSERSNAVKVDNVSQTIIEKGIENIAHYTKRMVMSTEFVFDNAHHLSAVNVMHSNKALHGAPISLNTLMNTLLKYFVGEDYSISASMTPLHSRIEKKQPLNQSEATNLFLWLTLLPIGPLLLISTVILLPTIEYSKSTKILEQLCGVNATIYWLLNFLWDFLYYMSWIFISTIVWIIFFSPTETGYLLFIFLIYGVSYIPYAYFFSYSKTVETAYAKFLITHILFAPVITGILLVLEAADCSSEIFKWTCFVLDPHILLCYLLSKFSGKVIANHNWDIMPPERKKFLCYEKPVPCCRPESEECANDRAYVENINQILIYTFAVSFAYIFILISLETLYLCVNAKLTSIFFETNNSTDTVDHTNEAVKTDSEKIIYADNISKKYVTLRSMTRGGISAVKNLKIQLSKGDCFGLLGMNGAGKSTSFRILTDQEKPTGGTLNRTYKRMGYCPQQNALLDDLTGKELLQFYVHLRNRRGNDTLINRLLETFGLEKIADRPCGTYSGGNKRKLSTCISIVGQPDCILLDEPTSGVDPFSRRELWKLIGEIKQQKNTGIILTSHSMDECEALCDRICILKEGSVKTIASIDELRKHYGVGHTLKVKFVVPNKTKLDGNDDVDIKTNKKKEKNKAKTKQLPKSTPSEKKEIALQKLLIEDFGEGNIKNLGTQNGIMNIRILNSNWIKIFKNMQEVEKNDDIGVDDYWIKEGSLEDIYMQIAKESHKDQEKEILKLSDRNTELV